jgi:hypothetical protein
MDVNDRGIMVTHKIQQGQTILDIALIVFGSIENAPDIAKLNGLGLTDSLAIGTELLLPVLTIGSVESKVVRYFVDSGVSPATNL